MKRPRFIPVNAKTSLNVVNIGAFPIHICIAGIFPDRFLIHRFARHWWKVGFAMREPVDKFLGKYSLYFNHPLGNIVNLSACLFAKLITENE